MSDPIKYYADLETAERLDQLLTRKISSAHPEWKLSRAQIKQAIEQGLATVNQKIILKAGGLVQPGSEVIFQFRPAESTTIVPYDFPLEVLFEDSAVMVINKPAGLTMHPGAGRPEETLVNAVQHHLLQRGETPLETDGTNAARPGIVHRLDHDTTGVVVVAKTRESLWSLARQFAARSTGRTYEALVFTTPRSRRQLNLAESGTISAPLGRHPKQRTKIAVVAEGEGRKAVTHWAVAERYVYGTLLHLKLETGRTHQIRVHLESVGSPVVGDRTYGDFSGLPHGLRIAAESFGRQALHAYRLEFDHPTTGQRLTFEAPRPADFSQLLAAFRGEQREQ